jgi:hypothetical protein
VSAIALAALSASCAATDDQGADAIVASAELAPELGPLTGPKVTSVTVSGPACPEGSYAVSLTEDGQAGTIVFSRSFMSRCTVRLAFDQAAGFRVGPPVIFVNAVRGFEGKPELRVREGFVGRRSVSRRYPLPTEETLVALGPTADRALISPPCGQARGAYEFSLEPRALPAGDGLDVVIDFSFWHVSGVRAYTCSGRPVQATPKAGELCGGLLPLACGKGLECDADPRGLGNCFDPKVPEPKSERHQVCGGARRIECQDGLTCSYADEATSKAPRARGECLVAEEALGKTCGGFPVIGCESGLVCWRRDNAPEDSSFTCQPPVTQEEDGPCGGTPARSCAAPLVCAGSQCRRVDGKVGAYCESAAACDAGLVCSAARCADDSAWSVVGEGKRCGRFAKAKCEAGLVCSGMLVCEKP